METNTKLLRLQMAECRSLMLAVLRLKRPKLIRTPTLVVSEKGDTKDAKEGSKER